MKTILSVMIAVALSLNAAAGDDFDKLFSKYAASDGITSVNLTESIIRIASNFLNEEDKDAKDLLRDIESVKLLTSEGVSMDKLAADAKALLKAGDYEDLIRVNEEDEYVRIMVKEDNDIIRDIIVFVESPDEVVFINVTGGIDPEKVGKALKSLDIEVDGIDMH